MKDNTLGILVIIGIIMWFGCLGVWSYFDHKTFPNVVKTPEQLWLWFKFIFLSLVSISVVTWIITYFKCMRGQ